MGELRRLLIAGLCLVLGPSFGLLLLSAPPAGATVTTLCTGYTGCTLLGMSDAGYGAANKTMYWRMYSGHNCTNYAAYRMVKAGMPNVRPWSGSGNATYWGTSMPKITNSTPTVGSIAWWKAGVKPAGSAGHVAYVEKVVSADEIIVSQDSWGGNFSWARITRYSSGWPSGFIHFRDPTPTPTPAPTPPAPKPSPTVPSPTVPAPSKPAPSTAPTITGKPTLRGTAKPGQTLEVVLPQLPSGVTAAVQWLRDGTAVRGATSRTYVPGAADLGHRLKAEVRFTGSGVSQTASTGATALVRTPAQVRVSTTPGSRSFSFTAQVTGFQGSPVNGNLQVRRNGHLLKTVPVHDGVATGTVTGQRPGTRAYRFRAQYSPTTTRGQVSARVAVLRR